MTKVSSGSLDWRFIFTWKWDGFVSCFPNVGQPSGNIPIHARLEPLFTGREPRLVSNPLYFGWPLLNPASLDNWCGELNCWDKPYGFRHGFRWRQPSWQHSSLMVLLGKRTFDKLDVWRVWEIDYCQMNWSKSFIMLYIVSFLLEAIKLKIILVWKYASIQRLHRVSHQH